jgi:SAM-dependent methyltransferase
MPLSDNVIRLLGRYSEGLRLAAEYGPSSGEVSEHAFQNVPQGSGILGRLIDRGFLHLSAWDSIRQRHQTTKQLVAELLAQRRAAGRPTTILDIGAGTGRYLRELAREHGGDDLQIICQDRDARRVLLGRQLATAEGLRHFTFAVGDGTDDCSYLMPGDPDIILAVSLFPHLHDDEEIRTVLRLTFRHLKAGGCLICTTLTSGSARLAPWEANGSTSGITIRSPEAVARSLTAAGFVRIRERFSQPGGVALVAWKPG